MFLQTSVHEGFCLPILEAMAAGAPVVCTDAHGNRDFCRDGVNCLMPASDPRAVTDGARGTCWATPTCRRRLRAGGRETAQAYALERKLDELDGLLPRPGRAPRVRRDAGARRARRHHVVPGTGGAVAAGRPASASARSQPRLSAMCHTRRCSTLTRSTLP